MQEFLIVKTSSIGDVIQTFHLVDYLKKCFPQCHVDWVVEKEVSSLLQSHPQLDSVIEVDTRLWRKSVIEHRKAIGSFRKQLHQKTYDVLFDLQGNIKSGIITAMAKADKKVGYSWNSLPEKPNYFSTNVHLPIQKKGNVRNRYMQLLENFFGIQEKGLVKPLRLNLQPEEEIRLQRFAQMGFQRPRLMICFGSNWQNKMLLEETLIEFLRLIDEKISPAFFFIFGNEEEKKRADALERIFSRNGQTIGEMSLPLWQRYMDLVEGVIAMDSAALHLCSTTNTPSFSLFGPTSASAYKPIGEKHRSFQGKCPYGIQFDKRCPHLRSCKTGSCLKDVSAEMLFEEFQDFWNCVSKTSLVSAGS